MQIINVKWLKNLMFDGCSPLKEESEKAEKSTTMREKRAWRKFWLACDNEINFCYWTKLEMVEGNPNNLIPWCGKCTENKFSQFHVHHYNIILFSFRIVLWVRRGKIIDSKMKGRRIWSCRELQKGKFDLYR